MRFHPAVLAMLLSCTALCGAPKETAPIRALLVTGGCYHDYTHQKTILTEGISARANVVWSIVHEGDGSTDHRLSLYDDPDWAKHFDVVVHDECFADVKDATFVRGILKPHREGLPAVNLHCAMHCYRVDFDHFKEWFEFTGIDSRSHGAQLPIALSYTATNETILKTLGNWSTGPEELYNNVETWKTVTPLIYGQQGNDKSLVAWMNNYRGTRVFSTTLGHNNATVADPRYLDLVTRGLLWSVNKLDADHLKPAKIKRRAQKMVRVPINLALNKKATASASENGHPPELSIDDNPETRWCAPDGGSNYWWQVDLGTPQDVTGTRIIWEKDNTVYEYKVDGSVDGKAWNMLLEKKGEARPQVDEQKFSANGIRYVRVTITKASPGAWFSFFEFEVQGKELVERPAMDTPDALMTGVRSPAGFEQTLFAGPTNISYPTCLEATPWGDVFVGVDLNGSLDQERNRGWVVRCRDTNNDGTADEFLTFAKMDSPRGLVFDDNTLYVMHPPLLEAFHDDNGDGKADRSEVLVRGLANDLNFRGADHTCNGVRMGIDGWLYIALGDYGALNAVAKDGSHLQLHGGGIVRVRPDGSQLEEVVRGTRNIYDVALDPFMNIFTCDNTNDGDDWNLRLSHMIPTGQYGYPSLFRNFPNEIMPAMRDFGGGSPTGALFLDEPGLPDDFGYGLYTCQWGWNNVSRHPLKKTGATFSAEKETFLNIPRPTGIATDGLGNLYVASWKGATFNFAGANAGFVARISPVGNEPIGFPNLHQQSEKQLIQLLASPSATQRLHVQREILRRKNSGSFIKPLRDLALSRQSLPVRAAAIFTLGQIAQPTAVDSLLKLSKEPALRELALKALKDSKLQTSAMARLFVESLSDREPSVRLQAVIALNRIGHRDAAAHLVPLLLDKDSAVAHAAFRTLVAFGADNVCFQAIDSNNAELARASLRVLGNLHKTSVVDELLKRFSATESLKRPIFETLCRLYFREADWDGSWWTTRPDTSGPYYKAVTWDGTAKIQSLLEELIRQNDKETSRFLVLMTQKYKIELPALSPAMFELVITDPSLPAPDRKKAFQKVAQISVASAVHALLSCPIDEQFTAATRYEFVRDPQHAKSTELFAGLAKGGTSAESELAYTVLLFITQQTNAPTAARKLAEQTVAQGEHSTALKKARENGPKQTQTVRPIAAPTSELIAKLPYDQVLKRAGSASGDANVGEKLFDTVGCIKCHTVNKSELPKGPFLGDITARYSVAEILESILHPSAKVAQGFETTTLETKDGEEIDGFIVRESGDEIELRNITGPVVVQKRNIATRGTRKTSMMPDGLVDSISPEDLASLLRYLESMRMKN